jgi:CP family cyanate transporter-like MFS transporter
LTTQQPIHTTRKLKFKKETWILLIGIIFMASTLRAPLTGVGPLISSIRTDLGISNVLAGFVTTIPLLAFAVLSPFAPKIARRLGLQATIFYALLLLTAGILIRSFGTAPSLFIGTFLLGLAIAFGNVLLPSIIKMNFPLQIGLMTGIYTVSMNLSAAISAGISAPLSSATPYGWQGALGVWALLSLFALLIWLPQLKNRVKPSIAGGGKSAPIPTGKLWRSPLAWSITFFMGLQSLIFYTTAAWIPEVLKSQGMSGETAGWMFSLLQLSQLPMTFLIPIIADKVKDQRKIVMAVTFFYLVGFTGILFGSTSLIPLSMILMGIAGGASFGLAMMFFALRTRTPQESAELSGLAQSFGYLLAAIGPVLFGLLHDVSLDWKLPMIILFTAAILLFIAGMKAGKNEYISPETN